MAEIQLRLPARAENVALVRQALSGIGEHFAVEESLLSDMKTAVTEACNNVVLHAYPDSAGILDVRTLSDDSQVSVVVRDEGGGMQPRAIEPDEPSLGLGLPLIAALSDRFEIHGGIGRGIEVRMRFLLEESLAGNGIEVAADDDSAPAIDETTRSAGIAITPGPMMAIVIGRLTAMFASRADFPLDRLSDAVLVSDAISAHVSPYIEGRHAFLAFEDGDGTLDVRVGPLVSGGADELLQTMELPGIGGSLERLADEISVERPDGDEDYLHVRIVGSAVAPPGSAGSPERGS